MAEALQDDDRLTVRRNVAGDWVPVVLEAQALLGYVGEQGVSHLGDPNADGSWRITVSGTDLLVQRRESGSWTTKSKVGA